MIRLNTLVNKQRLTRITTGALLVVIALVVGISVVPPQAASAASIFANWEFNGDVSEGYFRNGSSSDMNYSHRIQCGYSNGCPVLPNGDYNYEAINGGFRSAGNRGDKRTSLSILHANMLIDQLQSYYNSGDAWSRMGSAFIVNTMLGYGVNDPNKSRTVSNAMWTEVRARIVSRASKDQIDWNVNFSSEGQDTYSRILTDSNGNNAAWDVVYDATWNTRNGIIIYNDDGSAAYKMWYLCANPVGAMSGMPVANFNLTPSITGTPSSTDGDASATITPAVTNDGPASTAGTVWETTKYTLPPSNTAAQTANGVRSSAEDAFAPTAHFGNGAATVATGTGNYSRGATNLTAINDQIGDLDVGTRVCYTLSVRPYNQSTTDWRHGTPFCIRVGKAPKVQVLGNDLITGRNFAGVSTPAPTSDVQSSVKVRRDAPVTPPFSTSMITGLWQTGVNDSGAKLAPGQSDPHWQLVNVYPANANGTTLRPASNDAHWNSNNNAPTCQPGPYPRSATVVNTNSVTVGINNAWKATLPNSAWIGAYSDAYTIGKSGSCAYPAHSGTLDQATYAKGPIWVFRLRDGFNVDQCVNPATIRLNLNLSADDEVQVLVNGVTIAQPGNFSHYGQWPSTPISYITNPSSAFRTGNNSFEIRLKSAYEYTGLLVNSISVASAQCSPIQPEHTYGSWVEYGILPTGTVRGTASGSAYAGNITTPLTYCQTAMLTFSNTPSGNVCSTNATLGGYRTGKTIPDIASYYPTQSSTPTLPASTSLSSVSSGTYRAPNNLEITGSTIPAGRTIVINAPNSTVTISGNIDYTTAALTRPEQIPQLVIIAANIRIAGPVTKIDAWLVAKGTLNTCTDVSAMTSLTSNTCRFTLTINGAVQARTLELWRTAGAGRNNNTGDPAEVFNLRPDTFLWGLSQSAQSGRLESVYEQELPPRF